MEKSRYFEELAVGEEFRSPSRTIAEYDLYVFAGLTGDLTNFHISTEAAKDSVFGQRAAHGMLLISFANGLYNRIGITDETGIALTGVEWRFLAPGFIGDTVHLVASVKEKRAVSKPDRGLVFWDARLVKSDGTIVCQGQMVRMVRRHSGR